MTAGRSAATGGSARRYVALGSSMAAGPGIRPEADDAPRGSGRSARNYAHLVAARCGYDLVDVTFSGATTGHVLTEAQSGAPPQVEALDGSEALVTITIGGNDAGYVPLLFAASLPRWVRWLPPVRGMLDAKARHAALDVVAGSLRAVGREVRRRAPEARVLFVDYLTLLPPPGTPAAPLTDRHADLGRHIAATLERHTADAAAETGCDLVRAGVASRDHHAWSADPWTTQPGLPLPHRVAPLHPNEAGMAAVAALIADRLGADS